MDYINGKIYMLEPVCDYEEGEVYYGSTASTLVKRLSQHKKKSNTCKSKILIDKYGRDNIKIVLMEEYSCENKNQLKAVEAKYQRENKCVNKNIAGRTNKERYYDNHQARLDYQRMYDDAHREDKKKYYQKKKLSNSNV